MLNKNKKINKKMITILVVLGVLLTVVFVAGFMFKDKLQSVVTATEASDQNHGKPKFVFDSEKFPDWATSGNIYTNPDDYTDESQISKDELPISSMNITQCKKGSNCNKLAEECEPYHDDKPACKKLAQVSMNTHCFVTVFYNERTINPDIEAAKYIEHIRSFGSIIVQDAGVKELTINTPEGDKQYKLYYYDYKNKSGETIQHGNAFGYISLAGGHINVRSVCAETNQLDETLPVLAAVRLMF